MLVKCPQCKKMVEYEGNPYRPFCSERCKIIDLGDWASEKHAIPTDDSVDEHNDPEKEFSEDQD